MSKTCKNWKTGENPIAEECAERNGVYTNDEIADNFWVNNNNSSGYWSVCKHCKWLERNTPTKRKSKYENWPTDKRGRLLNYWHIIDNTIVLKDKDEGK
jgi:hypothetical protein